MRHEPKLFCVQLLPIQSTGPLVKGSRRLKVKVYLLKSKPDPSEIEATSTIQKWMLENLYDLGWEAGFKTLVTPDLIASMFRVEPNPFGVPFKKKKLARDLSVGDVIQIGPTQYLILQKGFRELEGPKVGSSQRS